MSGLGLTFLRRGGQAHPTAGSDYIKFKDAEVLRVLMANGVSSDGVGITKDDAAKVTSISTWFKGNANIISFDELIYFTSLTSLSADAFNECTNLESVDLSNVVVLNDRCCRNCTSLVNVGNLNWAKVTKIGSSAFTTAPLQLDLVDLQNCTSYGAYAFNQVNVKRIRFGKNLTLPGEQYGNFTQNYGKFNVLEEVVLSDSQVALSSGNFASYSKLKKFIIPASVKSIGGNAFNGCSGLQSVIFLGETPPTIASYVFPWHTYWIYVPDTSVDAYKAVANLSSYVNKIKPLSEYQG